MKISKKRKIIFFKGMVVEVVLYTVYKIIFVRALSDKSPLNVK